MGTATKPRGKMAWEIISTFTRSKRRKEKQVLVLRGVLKVTYFENRKILILINLVLIRGKLLQVPILSNVALLILAFIGKAIYFYPK